MSHKPVKFTFTNNIQQTSPNADGELVPTTVWIMVTGRPGDPTLATTKEEVPKWSYGKATEYNRNELEWIETQSGDEFCPVGNPPADGGKDTYFFAAVPFGESQDIIIKEIVTSGRFYFLVQTGRWSKAALNTQYFPQLLAPDLDLYKSQPIQPTNGKSMVDDPANWGYPIPDMTAPPWGTDSQFPNFADKLEFTVTYWDPTKPETVQIWVNNTNVDNFSFPVQYALYGPTSAQLLSPIGSGGLGTYVGMKDTREAIFTDFATQFGVGTSNFWTSALIRGGKTRTGYGPIVYPLTDDTHIPSQYIRCVAPGKLVPQIPDEAMIQYINWVWEYYKTNSLWLNADPPKGSSLRPVYKGSVVGDAFIFVRCIGSPARDDPCVQQPGVPVASCDTKPTPNNVYGCDGPLLVASNEQGSIIRQLAAGLNRGIFPCSPSAPSCPCGEPSNPEQGFYTPTIIANGSIKGYNFYSKQVHKHSNSVTIGTANIRAAYGFPYDDVCSLSTTLSSLVGAVDHVSVNFPNWT